MILSRKAKILIGSGMAIVFVMFAVVASFIGLSRSIFYVYDEKGTLVYQELLPEDAETIAVIPTANSTEEILIGGKNTIWKFAAK